MRGLALLLVGVSALAGDLLLVVHKLADSVGYYDLATGKNVVTIPVGRKPHEFAFSSDERFAYVTNYGVDTYTETIPGGNTITVIDVAARKAAGEIDLGAYHRPHGIERGASGLFYVTTDAPAALLIVDGARRRVVNAIPITGKLPHMVQVSHDEQRAWTADAGSASVTAISLARKKQSGQVKVGGTPMGFALTRDETKLFVATRDGNEVVLLDPRPLVVKSRIKVEGQPARLLLTKDEKLLLVSLIAAGEIAAIDVQSLKEVRRAKAGARAEGMSLAPDGKTGFIAAQAENRIVRFSLPGLETLQKIETADKPDPSYYLRGR
jgi:DNA-binding beta-propeller fold protein YncE